MAADTESDSSAWGRTLGEANEMTERLKADGWQVATVRAGHVAPVPPGRGDADRFGLVYLAPDGAAESVAAAVETGDLDAYEVFGRRVGTDRFLLTRVTDADRRVAVLLVGAVDLGHPDAEALAAAARERGTVYSHVELLDGTRLASFAHDDPSLFFPDPE